MNIGRFVEDLLAGRRTRRDRPDDEEAARMRAAIALRAGRVGAGTPSEEFVTRLERDLAAELGDTPAPPASNRRRVLQFGSVAAAAATVAVVADRAVVAATVAEPGPSTLEPTNGTWVRVAAAADLPDGGVQPFDVDGVTGFVRREGGQVAAVSGACTHQGCRLRLDAPAHLLRCPCHTTAFAVTGELMVHQLPVAPPPLPRVQARQNGDDVEVLAPLST